MSDFVTAKYNRSEDYARGVAAGAIALVRAKPKETVFGCIFPQSMLDLVPAEFDIAPLGQAYAEQGIDEAAFSVSYPRKK